MRYVLAWQGFVIIWGLDREFGPNPFHVRGVEGVQRRCGGKKTTAGPSTASLAKYASDFAQDDTLFWVYQFWNRL
jgi:hypothetical protein